MAEKKKKLNKGLDAIFGGDITSLIDDIEHNTPESSQEKIKLDEIRPNPYQPRKVFDQEKLEELAQSIKENGLIQPIIVRKSPIIGFELLAGERRFRASKIAGLELVPAIIKELTDQEMMRQAIIENLQREDLNPIEEAISYQKLVDHGYKHDQIAQFMGKSRPYISNMLRLLHLAPSVQEAVIQNDISSAHARVLVPLDEKEQCFWLERIKQDHLNVRTLENKISSKRKQKNKKTKENFLLEEEQRLKKILGTDVTIHSSSQNKGTIQISFSSLDEYQRIINSLK